MTDYACDLHMHSCLSPCADNDMTPSNVAGMAFLNGIKIAALTDHNSCDNCPAFFDACRTVGVLPIAGMELESAEEIHLVCLFVTLAQAMAFGQAVAAHRMRVENRPEIFGDQLIMNEQDEVLGREKQLLISATDLSLEEATALVHAHGGAVYPAHIDRRSNGLLAILGDFPARPVFSAAELHDPKQLQRYQQMNEMYRSLHLVSASDAHRLCDISEGEHVVSGDIFPVPLEQMEQDSARRHLLHWLDETVLLE